MTNGVIKQCTQNLAVSSLLTAKKMALNAAVRDMAIISGRKVTGDDTNQASSTTYMHCAHELQILKLEVDIVNDEFIRLSIILWEGL